MRERERERKREREKERKRERVSRKPIMAVVPESIEAVAAVV